MKSQLERSQMKRNIMEKIVFHIDYAGLPSIENFIERFFLKYGNDRFGSYQITFYDQIELETLDILEVSRTLSVSVKELQKQEIHRLTKNSFGPDGLTLDISKYFSILSIECFEYENIDEYLAFFAELVDLIKDYNKAVSFRRFNLRKIGSNLYKSYDDIFVDFEKSNFYSQISDQYTKEKAEYSDILLSLDGMYKFVYRRSIESGYLRNPNGEDSTGYRVILDINGLIDSAVLSLIVNNSTSFKDLVTALNHNHLWELFKVSVTEDFLIRNSNE